MVLVCLRMYTFHASLTAFTPATRFLFPSKGTAYFCPEVPMFTLAYATIASGM
jgi:hypothetical protein